MFRVVVLIIMLLARFFFIPLPKAYAATTPDLGTTATFGILSSTFTRNVGLTAITGDLGYTTKSGSGTDSVSGTTTTPKPTQAGTDQATALTSLNSQTCDFSFVGATDLSLISQPLTPGVYCITGAQSIGTGGITLSGSGTYIFRSTGTLTTANGSQVTLSGSSACDVFWTPVATTLGANTTFAGTVIDNTGITVGNTTTWTGRALDFATTVTTDTDTITVPTCTTPTPTPTPTPTATPTPTSTPNSTTSSSNSSSGGLSSTISTEADPNISYIAPIIIESSRIDEDSIFLSWGPYSGIDTFTVQYGFQNGDWLYSTNVTGFQTTINDLPTNQPIWVRVAARNNSVGIYGEAILAGGPSLPNAGFAPQNHNVTWYILPEIIVLSSILLKLRAKYL